METASLSQQIYVARRPGGLQRDLMESLLPNLGSILWFPFLKGGNIFCKGDYLTCDITTCKTCNPVSLSTGTLIGNFDPVSGDTQKGS